MKALQSHHPTMFIKHNKIIPRKESTEVQITQKQEKKEETLTKKNINIKGKLGKVKCQKMC